MPVRRPSERMFERRVQELARHKRLREELQALAAGKESALWKSISRRVEAKLSQAETALDNYLSLTERQTNAALEERKVLRYLLSLVENVEPALESTEKRITELEEEIKERRPR